MCGMRVPEAVVNIKIEKIIPPWTVTREVYTESLTPRHSGISNDILLFSDIGLSLSHHCRVHKKGVPHVTFRKDYMSQLHAMLPLPAAPLAKSVPPGVGLFGIGGVAGSSGQFSMTVQAGVHSQTHTAGQGDTHTNRTPSDGTGPTGRGGSYGVGLS